jgi:tetratricopeptide (TPR) repeat protein
MAQSFFNQGLRLIYGYYFPEAIASFQEALRHDPDNPIIYWGLSLAMSPNPNSRFLGFPDDPLGEGRKAITAARTGVARASEVEKALIEALFVRYDKMTYPDRAERDKKYIEASRALLDKHPNDLEAGFMFADAVMTHLQWKYWNRDGSPQPDTLDAAAALEHIMDIEPGHPGAVHLYIHLLESSAEPERALPQADRLESLMPRAGHVVHMPSHIYIRVGQYDKAIAANERSLAADRFLTSTWGERELPAIGTYALSHRSHGRHASDFTRYAAMLQGNYARTVEAARASATGQTHLGGAAAHRLHATTWLVHKIFGKWEAVLSEPRPSPGSPYLQGLWHYARGSAYVGRKEFDRANSELEQLKAAAREPSIKAVLTVANPASTILELATHALEGEIAMARGSNDAAIRAFEAAVRLQDTLNYIEPPDWGQSIRLYLGTALLRAKRPQEAEAVFREDLREFMENGWALFGLWQSLRDQGKTVQARAVRGRFDRAWKNSDVTLESAIF